MTGRFVLDSYALIGYLENEPFADRIEKYLKQAKRAEASLYLHAIHLGEVYYITLREQGQNAADLAYARIKAFPLTFVDKIDEELLLKAASLKAGYPISYADSFAAALANIHNCALLTGDPELKILEKERIISIVWLTS
ncbi:MAG: type II toxin-antitoxin system VapC family toxin [Desulfobacterales bacterium]